LSRINLLGSGLVVLLSVSSVAAQSAPATDRLLTAARRQFSPLPASPPKLANNPATPAKLKLGKMLFFDPRLSASHAISCNSCHNIGLGGVDLESTSLGHRWQHGGRNAPTVLNSVFNTAQFWDGRAKDLEQQADGPMINPVEMASPKAHVAEQLKSIPGYRAPFTAAFPGDKDPITLTNVQKAIAVFEATLLTPNAPFDRFLKGQASALSPRQKEGLAVFMDKGCSGAELLPPGDTGRFAVTNTSSDKYVYKVPTLRNIALTAPYFHTGKSWDLRQAVAVMGTSQLGVQLKADEIDKITDFLSSLTGDQPQIVYPALPPSTAGTSRPQP
jgi:cytochrome c peroxidase